MPPRSRSSDTNSDLASLREAAHEALTMATTAHQRIDDHEKACEERHSNIMKNFDGLYSLAKVSAGTTILTLLSIVGYLLSRMIDKLPP